MIRLLLDDRADFGVAPVELTVGEGYGEWAASYDQPDNPLITVEGPMVDATAARAAP